MQYIQDLNPNIHPPDVRHDAEQALSKAKDDVEEKKQALSNARNKVRQALSNAGNKVKQALPNARKKVRQTLSNDEQNVENKIKKTFDVNRNFTFGPINIQKNITLFRQTINCPPLFPGVEVDLNPIVQAHGTIGIAASGTIVPPHIADFSSVTSK